MVRKYYSRCWVVFISGNEIGSNCIAQSGFVSGEFVDAVGIAPQIVNRVELILRENLIPGRVSPVVF